jgi:hypothetical protein
LRVLLNYWYPFNTGMLRELPRIPPSSPVPSRAPAWKNQAFAARQLSPTPVPTMTAPRRHANTTIALAARRCIMLRLEYCPPK